MKLLGPLIIAAWCVFLARALRLEGFALILFAGATVIFIGWSWALVMIVDDLVNHHVE